MQFILSLLFPSSRPRALMPPRSFLKPAALLIVSGHPSSARRCASGRVGCGGERRCPSTSCSVHQAASIDPRQCLVQMVSGGVEVADQYVSDGGIVIRDDGYVGSKVRLITAPTSGTVDLFATGT
jgi:hypothetical protein